MFYHSHFRIRFLASASFVISLLGGCGTLAGNPESPKGGSGGTPSTIVPAGAPTSFKLGSIVAANVKSLFVTITDLSVTQNGTDWTSIPLTAVGSPTDLMTLQDGKTSTLGSAVHLASGTYTQTRLLLADKDPADLTTTAGSDQTLALPTNEQTGIVITTPFTVQDGISLDLTLAFDLRQSLNKASTAQTKTATTPSTPTPSQPPAPPPLPKFPPPPQQPLMLNQPQPSGALKSLANGFALVAASETYAFAPLIRLNNTATLGAITGTSTTIATVCVYPTEVTLDPSDSCSKSISSGISNDGVFKAALIPAGTYNVRLYSATVGTAPIDLSNVVVTAGQVLNLGAH